MMNLNGYATKHSWGHLRLCRELSERMCENPHEISFGKAGVADGFRTGQFVNTGRIIHS